MIVFEIFLLSFLIFCAVSVAFTRKVLTAVILFMSYSVVMSVIWLLMEAPDLAITEAAVGAGITTVLFFLTMRRIHSMKEERSHEK